MLITRRSHEAHIADLKEAHAREVAIMTAWIEQLQLQVGTFNSPRTPDQPKAINEQPGMALYLSSEEEDLVDAHAQGIINDEQFEMGMAELGRVSAEVT
jgi:hypothetical protein